MIWAGSSAGNSLQSVWLNLGVDLIATMVAVFLLAPIIERAELRRESVLERFNHNNFIRQVERARREVRILELWTDLLQGGYQRGFLAALREALSRKVEVRILLLSPESPAAEQREDDLRRARQGIDVEENIRDNLRTSVSSCRIYRRSSGIRWRCVSTRHYRQFRCTWWTAMR
jgi:hypothetical protein